MAFIINAPPAHAWIFDAGVSGLLISLGSFVLLGSIPIAVFCFVLPLYRSQSSHCGVLVFLVDLAAGKHGGKLRYHLLHPLAVP